MFCICFGDELFLNETIKNIGRYIFFIDTSTYVKKKKIKKGGKKNLKKLHIFFYINITRKNYFLPISIYYIIELFTHILCINERWLASLPTDWSV